MDAQNATHAGSSLSDRIVAHDDGTLSVDVPPILVEGVRVRLLHDYAVAAVQLADGFVNELPRMDHGEPRDPATVATDPHIDAARVECLRERCLEVVGAQQQLDTFGWLGAGEITLRRDREWWTRAACAEITDITGCLTATVEDGPRYADQDEWVERVATWQEHQAVAVAFLKALQAA